MVAGQKVQGPVSLRRRLRKSIKRLKLMGLNPKYHITQTEGYIFIELNDIIKVIANRVGQVPEGFTCSVYREGDLLVVAVKKVR